MLLMKIRNVLFQSALDVRFNCFQGGCILDHARMPSTVAQGQGASLRQQAGALLQLLLQGSHLADGRDGGKLLKIVPGGFYLL